MPLWLCAATTIAVEKLLKYFLPGDINAHDENMNGEAWELVDYLRRIDSEALQQVAIRQVRRQADMKSDAKK